MACTVLKVSGLVALVEVLPAHPALRTRFFEEVAREAILRAADEAGGSPMVHDDDLMLDQEATGGDMELALRILTEELVAQRFDPETVRMSVCPTCDAGAMQEWCPTCAGEGEVPPGTPAARERGLV